jgi:DNA-binding transcriptional MerR regulator
MKRGQGTEHYVPIPELASSLGISARTLRYYEEQGLIRAHRKGRTRIYSAEDINRMRTILRLKSFGLSVLEIRAVLTNPGDGPFGLTHEQWATQLAFLERKLADLQDAIAELGRARGSKT